MLTLQLLGGFELTGTEGPPLPTRKAEALFAFLALSRGQPQPRDKLATLLWSDRADAQARHSLAQTLYVIRRSLGETARAALRTDTRRVSLDPAKITVDVHDFETHSMGPSRAAFERAASIYRGELLEGLAVTDEAFEEWLRDERRRLQARALDADRHLLRLQVLEDDNAAAIITARRLLVRDSLQEQIHRTLMRLYSQSGRVDDAFRQFQCCTAILRRELDVEPAQETKELFAAIVAGRAPVAEKKVTLEAPAFRNIPLQPLNEAYSLNWFQFPYATRDWASSPEADLPVLAAIPGGYWARTLETLSSFVIRKRAALTAANTDYSRVVVTPPSETWPNCSAVPGRVSLPGSV